MTTRRSRTTMGVKRAAVYVRVSSEEQVQGYSLAAQERAAEALCVAQGWEIVGVYRDEGRSARTDNIAKRPRFSAMLADAEAGIIDVVVVHKLDRLARNRRVAFETFDRLGRAGIGFVSIAENMDYSTPAGQLMLTMLVGLGQFYSDNLSTETRKGKAERKAQGVYNGLLPFGVTKGPGGVPVLDTTTRFCDVATRSETSPGNGLVYAFQLAAAGKSDREIAQALNADGHRSSGNRGSNPFTKDSVRAIIRNRFFVGDLPDGKGGWVPGKHGALIDPTLFAKAETERERYSLRPKRVAGNRSPWALSGIAVCGSCGKPVTADGNRRARCQGRAQGGECDQPSFFQSMVERDIGDLLANFDVPVKQRSGFVSAWRRSHRRPVDSAASRASLRGKLDRLRDVYLDGDLGDVEYRQRKAAILDQLAALPADTTPDTDAGDRLASYLADVAVAWKVATPAEQNKIARALFTSVVVDNRTAVACVPRPDLQPFFRTLAVKPGHGSCNSGSDGDRLREIEVVAPPLVPILYPERVLRSHDRSGTGRYAAGARPPRIPRERWDDIVARSKRESVRTIASEFGVSYETVRILIRNATSEDRSSSCRHQPA